jgi:hypothetical protein
VINRQTLLSGAAMNIIARPISGRAKNTPKTGIIIKPANAIISAKGNNMNPTTLLDIFSRTQSALSILISSDSYKLITAGHRDDLIFII